MVLLRLRRDVVMPQLLVTSDDSLHRYLLDPAPQKLCICAHLLQQFHYRYQRTLESTLAVPTALGRFELGVKLVYRVVSQMLKVGPEIVLLG